MLRTRSLVVLLLLSAAACAAPDSPLAPVASGPANALGDPPRKVVVTNNLDSGPGSLRAAFDEATADPAVVGITIMSGMEPIYLLSPVTFTGQQALSIEANGSTISGPSCVCEMVRFNIRSALTIRMLTVENTYGTGIRVELAPDATGTVRVTLADIYLRRHLESGIIINDQAGYVAGEPNASPAGSPASIRVELTNVHVQENGFGGIVYTGLGPDDYFYHYRPNQGGISINEAGDGDVVVVAKGVMALVNGFHGIAIDERGNGSVDLRMEHTNLVVNGFVWETAQGDNLRIDESGVGDLTARLYSVWSQNEAANDVQFSENGPGNLNATLSVVEMGAALQALNIQEDKVDAGGGNLFLDLTDARILRADSGAAAILVREGGEGNMESRLTRVTIDSVGTNGIKLVEEAGGTLRATLRSTIARRTGGAGVIYDESGAGDLIASTNLGRFDGNATWAMIARQWPLGAGTLTISGLPNMTGNGSGTVQADPAQVRVQITPW